MGCAREAVRYLVDPDAASSSDASASAFAPAATEAAKGMHRVFEAVVGMDEPPAEMT